MSEKIRQTTGIISSPVIESGNAELWHKLLKEIDQHSVVLKDALQDVSFIPAHWGKDALDILEPSLQEEAKKIIQHLDSEIDRNVAVENVSLSQVWGPFTDINGDTVLVFIADFDAARKSIDPPIA